MGLSDYGSTDDDEEDVGYHDIPFDELYRKPDPNTYTVDCTNCNNSFKRSTTGDYSPKTHMCRECGTWLWHWEEGESGWESEEKTREI